ncbi:hypothetical protein [Phycicoccus avicenniae]|uniref:hypothetical protein n=1 Tax=Phycicoccus avicenniae TaxID=2828860 RepID=UPI003D2A6D15
MSLATTIATGTLAGGLLAVGVYAVTAPPDQSAVRQPVAPTYAPVPTPTVTHLAGCTAPARLEHGVCVTHKPGPTVTLPATSRAASGTTTSAGRTARPAAPTTGPAVADDREDDHCDDQDDEDTGDDGGEHEDD